MISPFRLTHDCNSTVLVDISTCMSVVSRQRDHWASTTSSTHRIRSLFSARRRDLQADNDRS